MSTSEDVEQDLASDDGFTRVSGTTDAKPVEGFQVTSHTPDEVNEDDLTDIPQNDEQYVTPILVADFEKTESVMPSNEKQGQLHIKNSHGR